MSCYYPITAYRSKAGRQSNGAWPIVFSKAEGYVDLPVVVPCGKCIGCQGDKAREWAIRCVHEASLYKENCFVTLTYNTENLPGDSNVSKRELQLFLKKLRKHYDGRKIRYFGCGEYGENKQRPHYHGCFFNLDFPDKQLWTRTAGGPIFRSATLERIWGKGYCTIGDVTFASANYIAKYVVKKYETRKDIKSGKGNTDQVEEFALMSRRPGIGKEFVEKWYQDMYSHDKVVTNEGFVTRPPKYYDKIYEKINKEKMARIKFRRNHSIDESEQDWERLRTKEEIKKIKHKEQQLTRTFEKGIVTI